MEMKEVTGEAEAEREREKRAAVAVISSSARPLFSPQHLSASWTGFPGKFPTPPNFALSRHLIVAKRSRGARENHLRIPLNILQAVLQVFRKKTLPRAESSAGCTDSKLCHQST
ncbi:Hypothetical protein SMAX5B_007154 [Scophthalmus maximus]|uniref:Uncharacterized protein n=1 Tax=Scophthalmus maximus TaxID=52904 RepID=A0A2U9BX74_SCOMX|nr:Hypothetical protein SMAX5B_007154 [Scophthalmus maximus]